MGENKRTPHKGDVRVTGQAVQLSETEIKGRLIIKGNVLLTGEIIVEGPLIITGRMTVAKGARVEADEIIHNGELETED